MPIFHKNRQNLQTAKNDKSQQILQDQTTETHPIFCQNLENAVETETKKSAFFATKKSTPINKKHPQKNLTSNQAQTPQAPRKKFLKIFAAASLALITCATTLLAVAPFGASTAANAAAESEMTAQEKLAAGTLNLNPDTDPTIYTTESGLEIKFGGDTVDSGGLSGYCYFAMGTYNNSPVKWVIIGYNNTSYSTFAPQKILNWFNHNGGSSFQNYFYNISNPAGLAISNEMDKQAVMRSLLTSITNAVQNTTELDSGEFLCFSAGNLGSAVLNNSVSVSTRYDTSPLRTAIDNLFSSGLGLKEFEKAIIQPQTIKTYGYNTVRELNNAYLFPLAASWISASQNFCIETYLTTDTVRANGSTYYLRSGSNDSYNNFAGAFIDSKGVRYSGRADGAYGIRPAMVIKL